MLRSVSPARPALALAFCAAALSPALSRSAGADVPRPVRFPSIHGDVVVFSYAGDLWRASAAGGEARRLTSHEGLELFPKISPDGRSIAFSGEQSGARQVYVMPIEGGSPRQLTFYADVGVLPPRGGWDYWVQGWTPDGKVLVRCNRTPWGERPGRYCLVDPAGGLETTLPLPIGGSASFSPDGTKLAYTPVDREFRTWKRTRGGRAQDVWIYDLVAARSERITDDRGTDNFPMWAGNRLYFTSDRVGTLNLFVFDLDDRSTRQLTHFDEYDVLWPSLGDDAIVFQNGGGLYRFDLASERATAIPIAVHAELEATVPHFVDASDDVQAASISPSGQRVVLEARGELFTVPRKKGPTHRLTTTQGVRERDPAWSPDGRWIAYFSDASGEAELSLRPAVCDDADGCGEPRRLTRGNDVWASGPLWSPDSKRLAWNDRQRRLRVYELEGDRLVEVDKSDQGDFNRYVWSPDGRWLAYAKGHPETELVGLAVYSLDSGSSTFLGDGLTRDFEPAWSRDGRYLFFLSSRDFQLRFSDFEFNYVYDRSIRVFAAALDPTAPALFPPESDEEEGVEDGKGDDKKKDDKKKDDKKKDGKKKDDEKGTDEKGASEKSEPLVVDAAGFGARTVALPGVEAGTYLNLRAAEGALYYVRVGAGDERALVRYDLDERKAEDVLAGVQSFELVPDGSKILYRTAGGWGVVEAKPGQKAEGTRLDLSGVRLKIDLLAEWRQMYDEAWRITRDFFYDPKMHGMDWEAIGERYRRLVPGLGHRSELDFLLGEMLGELEAGHTYVDAGDEPRVARVGGGMLGCELELDAASGRYRIARILDGEAWDPAARSPLAEPGVGGREGQYLLAIDGEPLAYPDNPYRLLEGKAEQRVVLRLADDPAGRGARTVAVKTLGSETDLRYVDWVKSRMELVDRLSGGKIGYVHLPDTAIDGNSMLQKLFYAQVLKPALIVDDRYNGGGFIPDRMIEMLRRTPMSSWAQRDARSFRTPGFAHAGPKAMLINGYSSSGGDALPFYFRQAGLGPLIGTRTWGGLIGISGAPALSDGGAVLPPTFRIYDPSGRWVVENEGVSPDYEVVDLPEILARGGDPSIEKAVELLLAELAAHPGGPAPAPAPPDLSGNER